MHRILTAAISPANLSYSPPAAGTTGYSVNGLNQYISAGGAAHSYDQKGNLISDGIWGHAYDAENRLTATDKPGTVIAYAYDGLGRRISRTVNSVTTSYLLDGDEEVAEYDGSGALLRRYVYGPSIDDRILMYEGSGTAAANKRFYYANHQGSTMLTADGNGNLVDQYSYSPYGESVIATGNPFRYTGRRLDPETGLYYYRARYYSPRLGRFLQTDPIGYGDGLNWYAYVGNDPTNRIDPLGLLSYLVGRSVSGTAGIGKHAFIVTGAKFIGDNGPHVKTHSYGKLENGKAGNVGEGSSPASWSAGTAADDRLAWESGANIDVVEILAPDELVDSVAAAVLENQDYVALASPPAVNITNSNGIAFGVANEAARLAGSNQAFRGFSDPFSGGYYGWANRPFFSWTDNSDDGGEGCTWVQTPDGGGQLICPR